MKNVLQYIVFFGIVLFAGCMPEDIPMQPVLIDSSTKRQSIGMGALYGTQFFYSLKSQSIVRSQPINTWQIGFSCDEQNATVILNSALFMRLYEVKNTEDFLGLTTMPTIAERDWKYDTPSLTEDSTAFGVWYAKSEGKYSFNHNVYIIDLGADEIGKKLGFRKMQFVNITDKEYTIRIAELQNKNDTVITVTKQKDYQFIHLNVLSKPKVLYGEPEKNRWDLFFTRYTHLFYEPEFTAYSVTGVLINKERVRVSRDTAHHFEKVTRNNAETFSYRSSRDIIGYDWKYFDLENNKYYVNSKRAYVLKSEEGFYYMLRFTDFYDDKGVKGTVTYELKGL